MTKPAKPDPIAAIGRPSLPWLWLAALLLVGLLARLGLAELGRRHAYVMDHMCNVSWGASMERYGLASAYGLGVQNLEKIRIDSDQVAPELRDSVRPVVAPNHPPLMMAGYLLEYKLLSAIQGDGRNVLANTLAARLCFAVVPTVCDMILAIACGLLAAQLYGRRAGLIAGGIVWLAPPIMLNSAYWGQVDSVLMAPAVVMVLLMLRNRWLWAGVALGLGAMLKPQAVLLVPAAVFAAAVLQSAAGRPAWSHVTARLGKLSASAAAVIVIISLPWTVAQGSRWVQRSYLDNFTQLYPQTTAMAFNVWYADALRLDSTPGESLDEDAQILGISKGAWGKALMLAALAAITVLCWRKHGRRPEAVLVFTALWLWSTFMLPTRVHERYMIYAVPFVLVLAAGARRFWLPAALIVLLGIAEHTWNNWLPAPNGRPAPAGSFMHPSVLRGQYDSNLAAFEAFQATQPAESRRPAPTFEQFRQQYLEATRGVFGQYLQLRRPAIPLELAVLLISLAGYGLAFRAAARPAPAPAGASAAGDRTGRSRRRLDGAEH